MVCCVLALMVMSACGRLLAPLRTTRRGRTRREAGFAPAASRPAPTGRDERAIRSASPQVAA